MSDERPASASSRTGAVIRVYSRPGCHLCEDTIALLESLRRDRAFELEVVDVDADPETRRRYGNAIPVLEMPGGDTMAAPIDERALASAVHRLAKWP